MQATVSRFDDTTRSGTVFLDDGVELGFDSQALAGTGLRMLRPGQRVQLEVSGTGVDRRIERVQILTLA
jgi:2-phospho-L-lactate guanylyltransferase